MPQTTGLTYRLGTELGGEGCSYGRDEEHVQLLVETQEVAEGQDHHFPGVCVQPRSDLCQHRLWGTTWR